MVEKAISSFFSPKKVLETFSETAVNVYKIKSCPKNDNLFEGKSLLEKPRCRRTFIIKVLTKGTGCKIVNWSGASQDRISQKAVRR
jgi:hypothetical protein